MKRVVLAAISALAVISSLGSANAADIARRQQAMPVKAPLYAPYNWTGFYVGINGGGGWGRSNWDALGTGNFNVSGGMVGGTLGYNWQTGPVVFGLETDLDWSNVRGSTSTACATGCETKNTYLGTARGRIGYAFDRVLAYATGGLAYGDIKASRGGFGQDSTTKAGWTLGGGMEVALVGPWSVKAEYLYADLGKLSCSAASCGVPTDVKFNENIVRAGVNYRF
jgi:outer membrane immunogenic protein